MGQTHIAYDDPPLVSLKPGELQREWTGICASSYQAKTCDLEYQTVWIGKRMFVRAIADDTLIVGTDDLVTLTAADILFRFEFLFFGLVIFNNIRQEFRGVFLALTEQSGPRFMDIKSVHHTSLKDAKIWKIM